jgi:phosphoglycerol transferase MdoB-like AlkP superfamily enzyme
MLEILKALFMGLRFDIRLAMFITLPAIILINLPLNQKFLTRITGIGYALLLLTLNFIYFIDIGYYSYLRTRINSTIISFIANPIISLQMVTESYPWILITFMLILISCLSIFLFLKYIAQNIFDEKKPTNFFTKFLRVFVFLLVFAFGSYGSIRMYPLRWSEAFATTDSFLSNLSLNPILYITDTYSFRNSDFDTNELKKYYPEVAEFLGVKNPDINNLNFLRDYPGKIDVEKKKINVVIIIMESMAYFKTGLGGSKVNPTPYLDKLKTESLIFNNFYTPSVATARSVFSAITSLPDVSKVKSGTRNPFIVNQNTIMGQARNYDKYYFLGGSANWGNIRGILSYNIPGLKIFEEGSYESPRVDVWGISDLDLFKEAVKNLENRDNKEKPFFTVIQSAGFHRPYTIPQNSDDFKILTEKNVDPNLVHKYGFDSMAEFNAMRLQDYSLGRFFEMAKKTVWYENTIFFVFGDHALPHSNALNVPEWMKLQANNYHVPLIIHSKKHIAPGVENKIASEMDVMPTAAGLIGIPYKTRSLGRDLFDHEHDHYRAAFSYKWTAPYNLSFVDDTFYFEHIPYNSNSLLIKYKGKDNKDNVKDIYKAQYEKMEKLTKGLYEASRYLLQHNPKEY